MALQRDADAAGAEVGQVGEVARHAAQDERQGRGRRDRVEFGARADADEEQRIDARRLVGLAARDGVVEAGDLDRAGAAGDARAAGSCRPASAAFILPTPSAMDVSRGAAVPNGVGRSVSSRLRPPTPAVSSSSTVRLAFSALP